MSVSECPLPPSHPRHSACPPGFTLHRQHCYRVSDKPATFAGAEVACLGSPGQGWNSRLAWPADRWARDWMAALGQQQQGPGTELWLGLDGRSLWDEEELSMGGRSWVDSSGLIPAELDWAVDQPAEDPSLQCVHTDGAGLLVGGDCEEKRHYVCGAAPVNTPHPAVCPDGYVRYKQACYYRSQQRGDYNSSEKVCATHGGQVVLPPDRATFHFLRAWAAANKFGDFYLGLNFTTGDPAVPVRRTDGAAYNKSVDFAFDDSKDKFGFKGCAYMKKGVKYKPRDSECEKGPAISINGIYSEFTIYKYRLLEL